MREKRTVLILWPEEKRILLTIKFDVVLNKYYSLDTELLPLTNFEIPKNIPNF